MKLHAARKFSVTQKRKIQEIEEETGAKLSKKLQISNNNKKINKCLWLCNSRKTSIKNYTNS